MIYRNKPMNELVSLRDAVDKLFEQSFVRPGTAGATERPGRTMAVNLCEKDEIYYVQAFLPGAKADEVEISVDHNTLKLKARIPSELEKEDAAAYRWYITELGYGDVSRSITSPSLIDADRIEAVREWRADVVAISATMTFHVSQVGRLVNLLRAGGKGIAPGIIVGGLVFNIAPGLWKKLGADGYAGDGRQAVILARQLAESRAG